MTAAICQCGAAVRLVAGSVAGMDAEGWYLDPVEAVRERLTVVAPA